MREYTELDKLRFAARAEESQSTFLRMRVLFSFLSVFVVFLAINAQASPLENAAVRIGAVGTVLATLLLYAGWRYAPAFSVGVLALSLVVGSVLGFKDREGVHGLAWALYAMFLFVAYARSARATGFAGKDESHAERERVRYWVARLRASQPDPSVVQFTSGNFWNGGRRRVRVLRDEQWIVAATWRRRFGAVFDLTLEDMTSGDVSYSPARDSLMIGTSFFQQIQFLAGSSEEQLAQLLANTDKRRTHGTLHL